MEEMFGASTDGRLSQSDKRALMQRALSSLPADKLMTQLATAAQLPIARQMIENAVMRKLFRTEPMDGPVYMFQLKRRQVAMTIAKYGAAPTRIVSYPRGTIAPFYIQVMPEIELSDLMDAMFDAASDIMDDAGKEMSVKEDNEWLRLFAIACPIGLTTATTVTPTVSDGPGGVGKKLNVSTYRVGTAVTAPDGGLTGEPSARDLIMAINYPRAIGYEVDSLLFNPIGLGLLSAQTAFSSYLNWGTREVAETGMIQNMFGQRVVWSALAPAKSIYMFDASELGILLEREGITVSPEKQGLRMRWLVYERIALLIRNANALFRLDYYV